jgi:hypothetical protein
MLYSCERKKLQENAMPAKTQVSQIIVSTVAEICAFKII